MTNDDDLETTSNNNKLQHATPPLVAVDYSQAVIVTMDEDTTSTAAANDGQRMQQTTTPLVTGAALVYGTTSVANRSNAMIRNATRLYPQDDNDNDESNAINASLLGDDASSLACNNNNNNIAWPDDAWCAVVFGLHLTVMLVLGHTVAPRGFAILESIDWQQAIRDNTTPDDDLTPDDWQNLQTAGTVLQQFARTYWPRVVTALILPCAGMALLLVLASMRVAAAVVTVALVTWLGGAVAVWLGLTLRTGNGLLSVLLLIVLWTTVVRPVVTTAWPHRARAATSLGVALRGIRRNAGVCLAACGWAELGFVWIVYWAYTVVGVSLHQTTACRAAVWQDMSHEYTYNYTTASMASSSSNVTNATTGNNSTSVLPLPPHNHHNWLNFDDPLAPNYTAACAPPLGAVVFFLVSLYWTAMVIMNTMQVTVAGVMATWCLDKRQAQHCCSLAVQGSLLRAVTVSLGSICWGSLLQGPVGVLRKIMVPTSHNNNNNTTTWFHRNVTQVLQNAVRYVHPWAYCYVGIYGTSFWSSGRRLWRQILSSSANDNTHDDTAVAATLTVVAAVVAILTGLFAMLLDDLIPAGSNDDDSYPAHNSYFGLPREIIFTLGLVVGFWIASVLNQVVQGAVHTLIVCWADAPEQLEAQHPSVARDFARTGPVL